MNCFHIHVWQLRIGMDISVVEEQEQGVAAQHLAPQPRHQGQEEESSQ